MAVQTLPNTKNDLIISLVQRELSASAKLAPFVSDYSAFAKKGVKSVSVPRLSSFSVANRGFGAAGTQSTLTDAVDTINLDQNAYLAWGEDHADIVQSSIEFRTEAATRAAAAHGRDIDEQLIAGFELVAYNSINGAVPADITKADFLTLREDVLKENGKLEDMVYILGVDQEHIALGISDFMHANIYGAANIQTGVIGKLYGIPVVVSNLVKPQQAFCVEKSGYGMAIQKSLGMAEQPDVDFGTQGVKVAMDMLWGHGGLQLGVGSAAATKSPLISKLTD